MGTIANAKVTHYYNCYNGDFIGCLPTANKPYNKNLRILAIQFRKPEAAFTESCNKIPGYITNKKLF